MNSKSREVYWQTFLHLRDSALANNANNSRPSVVQTLSIPAGQINYNPKIIWIIWEVNYSNK